MTEAEQTNQPCPCCHGTELSNRSVAFDWDELNELAMEEWADDVGLIEMIECRGCLCSAPVQAWNKRSEPPLAPEATHVDN